MAIAYPYFLVGSYVVQALHPAFLPPGGAFGSDVEQLRALDRRSTDFLLFAATVLLLGAAAAGRRYRRGPTRNAGVVSG